MAKPTFELTADGTTARLRVSGDLSVQHAFDIKTNFLLARAKTITHLDFSDVTSFDPAAIQMVYLLKREIEQGGSTAIVTLPVTSSLKSLMDKTGITKFLNNHV